MANHLRSELALTALEMALQQRWPTEVFRSQTEARMAVFDFVEGWYNRNPSPLGA